MYDQIITVEDYIKRYNDNHDRTIEYMYQLHLRLGVKFNDYLTLMKIEWKGWGSSRRNRLQHICFWENV